MLQIEGRSSGDDASETVIIHFWCTEAHLREGMDHPWPILAISDTPLEGLQLLPSQKAIND